MIRRVSRNETSLQHPPRAHADMMTRDDANNPTLPRSRPAEVARPRLKVSELLEGGREAILEHDGQDYRLRITANGKLILTK